MTAEHHVPVQNKQQQYQGYSHRLDVHSLLTSMSRYVLQYCIYLRALKADAQSH